MTNKQIKYFLSSLNYETEKKIPLNEVSSIFLSNDGYLFPDQNTRFLFKETSSTTGVVLVYNGKVENGVWKETETLPRAAIGFDSISGFCMITPTHQQMPYLYGRTV